MEKNYKQFVDKLNAYIRKFYLYQLVRGLILFVLVFLAYFSFIAILEYFSYFETGIKIVILLVTIFLTFVIFFYFVFTPVIKLVGLGKRLSYYDVSNRLSKTFPEIKDKLINIIELESDSNLVYSSDLKRASIDQKINELKVYQFGDSVRFRDLKRIVILFCFISLTVFISFVKFPSYYTESSVRLIHFKQKFEKPAPFTFNLENSGLNIVSGESIELKLHCIGKELPEMMYVNFGGNNFLMNRKGDYYFYNIENLNSSLSIYFTDKKYISDLYKITVINKPFVSSFDVEVQPPVYTNLPNEKFHNIGDFKVAIGTLLKWSFKASDTDSLFLVFSDSSKVAARKVNDSFEVKKVINSDIGYRVLVKNSFINDENNLVYKIQSISDLYPEIGVVQIQDSIDFKVRHFKGNIVDDYGFHQLGLTVSTDGKDSLFTIPFVPFMLSQDFYYSFDFESVRNMGKTFKYYFTVYDNDYINHFKKSISETFTFTFPDYQEILAKENSDQNSLDLLFKKSNKLTDEIKQEFRNLKLKQINSELSDWDKFQTVNDIMHKKNELENVLDQIQQQNRDANNFLKSFCEERSDILKKQQLIDELLKDVFTDELKKLFDEFNELAKQFDSKKFDQLSKGMNNKLDDLSKQLEKNLQLLKKMKVEQKVQRVIDALKKLSESEKEISGRIEKRNDLDKISDVEKENKLLVDNLLKDYNTAYELNRELDKPLKLFNFDNEFSGLKENYNKVLENIEKGNKRKSISEIQNNTKSIDQLAFAMQQMISSIKMKQNQENVEALKQILNNLITISFDQENLLKKYSSVDFNNPLVNELRGKQKDLIGRVVFVKDSLYALAKRAPEVGSVVNKEVLNLENSSNSAFDNLESGNIGGTRMYQQYAITAANNLALFLSEALESIKEQEKNSQPGDGDCEKPGSKSKPSMKSLKESQMSIKEQLQKMIDDMKKGDSRQLSKSIGQTLAQQEMMQQLMREMMSSGSLGSKASDQLKIIDQLLEQSKRDLINKNINSEIVNRQNLILSKLLEAEKAEIEREFDDKRESKTAVDEKKSNPQGYFEFINKAGVENEIIKRDNFRLRNFYDQKYSNFINRLKN